MGLDLVLFPAGLEGTNSRSSHIDPMKDRVEHAMKITPHYPFVSPEAKSRNPRHNDEGPEAWPAPCFPGQRGCDR